MRRLDRAASRVIHGTGLALLTAACAAELMTDGWEPAILVYGVVGYLLFAFGAWLMEVPDGD